MNVRCRTHASGVPSSSAASPWQGSPAISAAICGLLALSVSACGARSGVVAFSVAPPLTCSNTPVSVKWQVTGRAALKADPTPANWTEQVASQGELPVPVTTDTTFTVVALDANPASGKSSASQPVQVIPQANDRAAAASCDPSGKCTGTLNVVSGNSVKVSRLSNPSLKSGMNARPHEVCVTPPSGTRICVEPGASVALGVLANGTWAFDTTLAADESATPPPQLRMFFDFGCN